MITEWIILGFRPISLLIRRVWFNYNRVFNEFEFIFLNARRVRDRLRYCNSNPASIIFLKYFFISFYILI